jgi:hypothetical protein
MNTVTDTKVQDRSNEAVAFIDAWLNEHAWWADARAIDFALDVRAVLAQRDEADEDGASEETLTSVGATS